MQDPLIPEPALVRPPRPGEPGPDVLSQLVPVTPPPYSMPTTGGSSGQEGFLLAVLRGLGRRWRWVVGLGLLSSVVVGWLIWLLLPPPTPGATARLMIPLKLNAVQPGVEHPDPPLERQTLVAMLKSQFVVNAALRNEEVAKLPILKAEADPAEWMLKKVTADFLEGPEILRISLQCDDPEQARIMVNAIKEALVNEVIERSVTDRAARLKRLEELTTQAEETLKRKRQTKRLQSEDAPIDDKNAAQKQFFAHEQFEITKRDLLKLRSELQKSMLEEANLRGRLKGGTADLPDAVLDKQVEEDPRVIADELRRKKLDADLDDHKKKVVDPGATPTGKRLIAELEAWRQENGELRAKVKAERKDRSRNASTSDVNARLAVLEQQIGLQRDLEKALVDDAQRLEKYMRELRLSALDLEPLQMEIKNTETLVGRLQTAATSLKMEQGAPPRVFEMEKAVINRVDTERRRMLMALGGAAGALGLVIAVIGFIEFRLRRVESPESVTSGLGLRVVGTVPKPPFRWAPWGGEPADDHFEHWVAESISCTRTMLMHSDGLSRHRIIQITSPVSGEGKTTLSTRLAASVAQTGRRTLLVDGDLRNPTAHHRFNLSVGPGLCEVLRGEVSIQDVMRETPVTGLTMITAGCWKEETALALMSDELNGLFAAWRSEFDFVIVDSSPVLPVTDPLLLAMHADGVLVSLLQGVSRMPLATEAYKRMAALGVRVLGVVVNGTQSRGYAYSGNYFPKA